MSRWLAGFEGRHKGGDVGSESRARRGGIRKARNGDSEFFPRLFCGWYADDDVVVDVGSSGTSSTSSSGVGGAEWPCKWRRIAELGGSGG